VFLLIAVIVVAAIAFIGTYNSLIRRRNAIDQAEGTIHVQLTQRYDLIPKVVETVKQYMGHERGLLEEIVRLRSQAMGGGTPSERMAADNALTQAMGQLRISVENYPQLKSSDNFLHLQRTLNEVEEQLAASRRTFNASVVEYNNAIQSFPGMLLAGGMGMQARIGFVADEGKRADVDMKGLFKS
jgi:LemA protein